MAVFNGFDAPVPGQSLTQPPGNANWEHPPRFTKLDDACNYVFNQLMNENILHQMFSFFKSGVSVEALARIIIFSGFSQGLWTPDLGMLMANPIMFMLMGIAKRAGIKVKTTHVDRSPMKSLVGLQKIQMSVSNPDTNEPPKALVARMNGLMSPGG